jgi:hypothetical protein
VELHAKKTFTVTSAKTTNFTTTEDFLYDKYSNVITKASFLLLRVVKCSIRKDAGTKD